MTLQLILQQYPTKSSKIIEIPKNVYIQLLLMSWPGAQKSKNIEICYNLSKHLATIIETRGKHVGMR